MTASAVPVRHAQLRRYLVWQTGDFVMNTAIVTLVLFGLLGMLTIMNLRAQEAYMFAQHRVMPDAAKISSFREMFSTYAMVGPLIALSGVVSTDRSSGYTRFLFAKPMSPLRFYLQSFLLRFAGFLAVGAVLVFAYGFFEPAVFSPRLFADLSVVFFAVGGVVFLLSVVSKFDGLIAIVFLLVSSIVWAKWEKAEGVRHAATFLFPPIGKITELHLWLVQVNQLGNRAEIPFPTSSALWMAGYGLACAVLGLYLLRRIPLTKA